MRHTSRIGMVILGALLIALSPAAEAEEAAGTPQTHCPIMGGEIDEGVYRDVDGKRVYFSCPACFEKFDQDPQTHIKRLESEGIEFANAPVPQTLCPIMDEEIDSTVFLDWEEKRIYFCCAPCIKKFKKDPDTYLKTMAEKGVTLEEIPQVDDAANDTEPAKKTAHEHH